MQKKNTLLKIMSVILLIQGVLQLLSTGTLLMADFDSYKQEFPMIIFYISAILMALYGIAAVLGGYTGFRKNMDFEGCKRSFYYGLVLLIITAAMIVLNIVCHVFKVDQLTSFLIPGLYTYASFVGGRIR